ncbi:uncharacterized protein K489DRAFT_423084 [Dissoconium aciculare CBS 342.82]|uniref:Uncharacterized protein n=1 Tax=Dissoconium aciculare CBS 342.82 TaxID=1314786 RepID=A0A6J3M9M8_9PEZI|nr:uncharacterized protein K489DRAFT_423084 [Dissoconium aciculare CBS 342.82]KAF1824548.1 hypothetical protein K489DRAFT_423084 [Dissoconium aciculare CBS 342.82]
MCTIAHERVQRVGLDLHYIVSPRCGRLSAHVAPLGRSPERHLFAGGTTNLKNLAPFDAAGNNRARACARFAWSSNDMPPSYEHVRSGHSISPITPNGFCYRRTVHALHPTRMTAYVSFAGIHRQEVYRDAIAAASIRTTITKPLSKFHDPSRVQFATLEPVALSLSYVQHTGFGPICTTSGRCSDQQPNVIRVIHIRINGHITRRSSTKFEIAEARLMSDLRDCTVVHRRPNTTAFPYSLQVKGKCQSRYISKTCITITVQVPTSPGYHTTTAKFTIAPLSRPSSTRMELSSNDAATAIRNKQEWIRSCEKNASLASDPVQAEEWRAHARYERVELKRMEEAAAQARLKRHREEAQRQREKERQQQERGFQQQERESQQQEREFQQREEHRHRHGEEQRLAREERVVN